MVSRLRRILVLHTVVYIFFAYCCLALTDTGRCNVTISDDDISPQLLWMIELKIHHDEAVEFPEMKLPVRYVYG